MTRTATLVRTAAAPAHGADRVLEFGRLGVVVLFLTISPLLLLMYNWQYLDTGGGPLEKFHPATLLLAGLVAWLSARRANVLSGIIALLRQNRELLPFFAANAFMIFYAGRVLNLPVTIFFETFIGAALVYIIFRRLSPEAGHTLALAVHALLFLNALVAFYEVLSGNRLTPLVVNGEELIGEPRATALLGHPLANAILMGAYVVMLAVGGSRDLPAALRPIVFITAFASMVPFGGRAATAAVIASLLFLGAERFWQVLHGARFDTRAILAGLFVLPVACLAIVTASELGYLDTLTDRVLDDDGSAATRLEMFELFKYLSWRDLFLGPDPQVLSTWIRLHGLDYGLESFIVAFVLNFGILAALVFMPPLLQYLVNIVKACRPGAALTTVYFLAVALTSNSLSSKTTTLAIFTLLMMILLRRDPEPAPELLGLTARPHR